MPGALTRQAGLNMQIFSSRRAASGFTLLEIIFGIVLLGILVRFAMMKLVTPATMTLPAQAQAVAGLVRQAQALAVQRGQAMSVSVAASGPKLYKVTIACANGTMPCNTDKTNLIESQGVVVGGTGTVYFNSLGQPVVSAASPAPAASEPANFTLRYTTGSTTGTKTIVVSPLTGRVAVQ